MRNILGVLSLAIPYYLLHQLIPVGEYVWAIAALGALLGPVLQTGSNALGSQPDNTQTDALLNFSKGFTKPQSQKVLPPSLRFSQTGPLLESGIQGIGNLIQNPGQLSPGIAKALNALLSQKSGGIAQAFRSRPSGANIEQGTALNVAQEGAQRGAREGALGQTDALKRQDLGQTFNILDAILQFLSSARGQGIQGLGAAGQFNLGAQQQQQQQRAAGIASIGSALSSLGGGK